jgi:LuxR family maltose regulon positive regulatory protein
LVAEGRHGEAIEPLREAEQRYVSDFFPYVRPVAAMAARVHIRLGQLDEAQGWARSAGVTPEDALGYLREFEHITLARLFLAQGDAGKALGLLARLRDAAVDGGRFASVIEINVLTALALQSQGEVPRAIEALQVALARAEPERHLRPFAEEREELQGLLKMSVKRHSSGFLRSLLAQAPRAADVVHPDLIEPLSERELDVLRLLRSDMSGPELALHLSVSLNTLRTHTKNIFEKLGVNSRRAAVSRAGEMRLFDR